MVFTEMPTVQFVTMFLVEIKRVAGSMVWDLDDGGLWDFRALQFLERVFPGVPKRIGAEEDDFSRIFKSQNQGEIIKFCRGFRKPVDAFFHPVEFGLSGLSSRA